MIVLALIAVAAIVLVTGILPSADAGALGLRTAPVLGFVVAITIVAELARDAGVFDVLAQRLARWGRGRVVALWASVVALAMVSTVFLSLDTTAVIVTPVVIGLAANLGVDPRPLVLTVMIGASASFATPIGYQTNTLVYGPGGYKFADFIRFGVPLNLLCLVVVTIAMPLLYDF